MALNTESVETGLSDVLGAFLCDRSISLTLTFAAGGAASMILLATKDAIQGLDAPPSGARPDQTARPERGLVDGPMAALTGRRHYRDRPLGAVMARRRWRGWGSRMWRGRVVTLVT